MRDEIKQGSFTYLTFDSPGETERAALRALLTALRTRDAETYEHSTRVVRFSLLLGREYGLGGPQLRQLEFGSLLHDLGKIGVPDSILRKPARLTAEEWAVMQEHPQHGERILRGLEFLAGASLVVGQHHEQWNGGGYPRGLRGEEIDLNARILAVADAFDAMTSDRAYRARRSFEAAAEELDRCAGSQFDPAVVMAFRSLPPQCWRDLHGGRRTPRETGRASAGLYEKVRDAGHA